MKTFSLILFDYYGDSIFCASIFNENVVECEYPVIGPEKFFKMKDCLRADNACDIDLHGTTKYDKRASLFWFNSKLNIHEYYEIRIKNSYNDDSAQPLVRRVALL